MAQLTKHIGGRGGREGRMKTFYLIKITFNFITQPTIPTRSRCHRNLFSHRLQPLPLPITEERASHRRNNSEMEANL